MVFHLAAPYLQDVPASLRGWKPTGTLTVRVKYRGPFRLPAVRVVGVLSGPAQQDGRHAGAKARVAHSSGSGSGNAVSPPGDAERAARVAAGAAALYEQSRAVASTAVSMWNTMVETHSARWSQSLQTLQRVGSRILRSMSHDSVGDAGRGAGDGLGGASGSGAGAGAGGAEEGTGPDADELWHDAGADTDGAAAATAALALRDLEAQRRARGAAAGGASTSASAFANGASNNGSGSDMDAAEAALAEQEAALRLQIAQLGQLQASLSQFVTTASRREVDLTCMLADLSNIAYDVTQIVDGTLLEARHGLRLVACSHPDHAGAFGAALQAAGFACELPAAQPAHPAARRGAGAGEGAPAAAAGGEDMEGRAEAMFEVQLHPNWDEWEGEEAAALAAALRAPLGAPLAGDESVASHAAAPAAPCWGDSPAGMHGGYGYDAPSAAPGHGHGHHGGGAPMSPRSPVVVGALTLLDEAEEAALAAASCCAARAGGGAPAPRRGSFDGAAPASPAARLCSGGVPGGPAPAPPALHGAGAPTELRHAAPPAAAAQAWLADHAPPAAAPALDAEAPAPPAAAAPAERLSPRAQPTAASQQARAAAAAAEQAQAAQHPADWFVCDAPADAARGAAATRYFVIQGSITVDHWRINLTIDPVPFEDETTGVKVHRCAHTATRARMRARKHVRVQATHTHTHTRTLHPGACMPRHSPCTTTSCRSCASTSRAAAPTPRWPSPATASAAAWPPCSRCSWSTGARGAGGVASARPRGWARGAGAICLSAWPAGCRLPLTAAPARPPFARPRRGDLPARSLASVHTFGAPAVFCESTGHHACSGGGACACGAASAPSSPPSAAAAHPHVGALLPSLGLQPDVIQNVVMHRDIVPRAFVCDYSLVADVLKSWLPSFKGHTGLADCKSHKVGGARMRGARALGWAPARGAVWGALGRPLCQVLRSCCARVHEGTYTQHTHTHMQTHSPRCSTTLWGTSRCCSRRWARASLLRTRATSCCRPSRRSTSSQSPPARCLGTTPARAPAPASSSRAATSRWRGRSGA